MAEQRYQAVLAVISDGLSISQVAEKVGVSRQTLHTWLARYEAEGLDGLRIGTGTALYASGRPFNPDRGLHEGAAQGAISRFRCDQDRPF